MTCNMLSVSLVYVSPAIRSGLYANAASCVSLMVAWGLSRSFLQAPFWLMNDFSDKKAYACCRRCVSRVSSRDEPAKPAALCPAVPERLDYIWV